MEVRIFNFTLASPVVLDSMNLLRQPWKVERLGLDFRDEVLVIARTRSWASTGTLLFSFSLLFLFGQKTVCVASSSCASCSTFSLCEGPMFQRVSWNDHFHLERRATFAMGVCWGKEDRRLVLETKACIPCTILGWVLIVWRPSFFGFPCQWDTGCL